MSTKHYHNRTLSTPLPTQVVVACLIINIITEPPNTYVSHINARKGTGVFNIVEDVSTITQMREVSRKFGSTGETLTVSVALQDDLPGTILSVKRRRLWFLLKTAATPAGHSLGILPTFFLSRFCSWAEDSTELSLDLSLLLSCV